MKICIYTCIPDNNYDKLIEPKCINNDIDYICFTNNIYPLCNIWKIYPLPKEILGLPSNKINRYIKFFPNKLDILTKYDYTIYIDANSVIIDDFTNIIEIIENTNKSLYLQLHGKRDNVRDEANEIIRIHKDDASRVIKTLNKLKEDGFPDNLGLTNNNILIRKTNDVGLDNLMELWWEFINTYSKRDQLGLQYCIWKTNFNNYHIIDRLDISRNIKFTKHLLKNSPKIILCTLIKNNNLYMKEFIEYYYNLGFDKVLLGDNNDIDGERIEDSIDPRWIESGFVEIDNIRGEPDVQPRWYDEKYQSLKYQYNWFAFFDQDEFLNLPCVGNDVKKFLQLEQFKGKNTISFLWQYFDDNDLVYYDPRPLNERFTRCRYTPSNRNISMKFIIKGGLDVKISSAHNIYNNEYNIGKIINCDVFGNVIDWNWIVKNNKEHNMILGPQYRSIGLFKDEQIKYFNYAALKHFQYKTIEEFINQKIMSGLNHYCGKDLGRIKPKHFFGYNRYTYQKMKCVMEHKEEIEKALHSFVGYCKKNKDLSENGIYDNNLLAMYNRDKKIHENNEK